MKHSKSSLFLMELIIALLFFSLASTVCIRLFVNAHSLSSQTVDTNYAVNYAQNMAEAFIGCDGDMQALQAVMENSQLAEDGLSLSLEQNGYCTTVICSGPPDPGTTISADIHVCKPDASGDRLSADITDQSLLYTLHVELHIPRVK